MKEFITLTPEGKEFWGSYKPRMFVVVCEEATLNPETEWVMINKAGMKLNHAALAEVTVAMTDNVAFVEKSYNQHAFLKPLTVYLRSKDGWTF